VVGTPAFIATLFELILLSQPLQCILSALPKEPLPLADEHKIGPGKQSGHNERGSDERPDLPVVEDELFETHCGKADEPHEDKDSPDKACECVFVSNLDAL
jgi:hypothetical protein